MSRALPDIKSDPGRNRRTTLAGRGGVERGARGERHGRVTGRHKVPFVPIKTSSTECVRRYKEKRKRATRGNGTGQDGASGRGRGDTERSIGRRSSYDRTDRSDGPGFPLNSQYMIPGNRNEPAFTTSRGGTFPGNDTIEPQTRASSEETTMALAGALVLTKPRDAACCIHTYIYTYAHVYVYI